MTQHLFIPARFPGLNDFISALNHGRYHGNAMKQEYTELAAMYAKSKLNPVKNPVRISFVFQEPNARRDPDNIISAKKFILDGFKVAGIIPDDSQRWIKGLPSTWIVPPTDKVGKAQHQVGVMITIEEVT